MSAISDQARLALDAKEEAERNLARLSLCPPWRHTAFAALMAMLVATPAFSVTTRFALLAVIFASIVLIVRSDRRRLGVFINGYRRGKTRLVTFPMLAIIMGLYWTSFVFGDIRHRPEISLILAVVAFAVGYVGSVIWQRVFVRELRA